MRPNTETLVAPVELLVILHIFASVVLLIAFSEGLLACPVYCV